MIDSGRRIEALLEEMWTRLGQDTGVCVEAAEERQVLIDHAIAVSTQLGRVVAWLELTGMSPAAARELAAKGLEEGRSRLIAKHAMDVL